ncbi:MAG TPA: carbohydrate ABC transporter permease [Pseudonocardiaceae bacterium]|jgi:ABC-type glycerol-3-phosphate transport system permease component|nr:carbohydrate ABC transporter permease [Pseudonocardiaceae bacterium]
MTTTALPAAETTRADATARLRRRRFSPRVLTYLILVVYALISLYPFALMVSGALKNDQEIRVDGHLIPHQPTLATLAHTWTELHFFSYFTNSLEVTGFTTLGVLLIYSLAGYAFGVLDFPGRRLLYGLFVALLFVPGITMLLPIVILQSKLGILGTHVGIILPFINGTAPLSVLVMTSNFRAVPTELRESARCDGAGELRTFFSIYLPTCRPALTTIALLTAIPTWNEYVLTRVSLNDPTTFTLPIALQNLDSTLTPQQNVLMAASLIIVIPVVILFVLLQRYFVNGLQGAVKG